LADNLRFTFHKFQLDSSLPGKCSRSLADVPAPTSASPRLSGCRVASKGEHLARKPGQVLASKGEHSARRRGGSVLERSGGPLEPRHRADAGFTLRPRRLILAAMKNTISNSSTASLRRSFVKSLPPFAAA
jgi:hypothetical protein